MELKFCPILRAAGFANNKEICSEECALYVENGNYDGCALNILAKSFADKEEEADG